MLLKPIAIALFLLSFSNASGQYTYSDASADLLVLKANCETVARRYKSCCPKESDQYQFAEYLYDYVRHSIDNSIRHLDAKIHSGRRISYNDLHTMVDQAKDYSLALRRYMVAHPANHVHSLGASITIIMTPLASPGTPMPADRITGAMQKRSKKMHDVFEPCRLLPWESL